jgi:hypothetical protein
MDAVLAQFTIIVAMIVASPTAINTAQPSPVRQENRIDGTHSNGVIYFDAPLHSTPNYVR